MDNARFLFIAYGIVWAVLLVYVIYLLYRQKQLQKEITSFKETESIYEQIEM